MKKYVERNGFGYELVTCDVVEVTDNNGGKLGDIFINEGDWELILAGADPIAEEWEDGNGHILSVDGWGEEI